MPDHFLLVSNPPHPKIDAQAAGHVLGIPPHEANLKARYGLPEIWSAETDRSIIEEDAATLSAADMRYALITGEQLAAVPTQQLVRSVGMTDHGIALRTDAGTHELSDSQPMIVVPVSPRAAEGAPPGMRVTVAPSVQVFDVGPYIDVYLPDGSRFGIYEELVNFGELGGVAALLEIMRERLKRARFDDRLQNMQLRRPRQMLPAHVREARRGYSFASPGLDELLEAVSPDLQKLGQAEWSARLAFLTTLSSMAAR